MLKLVRRTTGATLQPCDKPLGQHFTNRTFHRFHIERASKRLKYNELLESQQIYRLSVDERRKKMEIRKKGEPWPDRRNETDWSGFRGQQIEQLGGRGW